MKKELYLVLVVISCFFFTCRERSFEYPNEIKQNDFTKEFDEAKTELYFLYLRCAPREFREDILSNDIDFFAVDTFNNEILILYKSLELEKIASKTDCHYYNGLGFNSQGEITLMSWGSSVIVDYEGISDNEKKEIINNIILPNASILNPWLKQIIMD